MDAPRGRGAGQTAGVQRQRTWLRAVAAGAVSTAAFVAWRWVADPVVGEGTLLPWSVLGLLVAAVTVVADRATRPFVGVATTAAGAGLGVALSGSRDAVAVGLAEGVVAAIAAALLAAGVSGLRLLVGSLPASRRPRAGLVLTLGGAAWLFPVGWWPLRDDEPADAEALLAVAAGTLLLATVVGETRIGRWWGPRLALPPAALLAVAPLAASDSLGMVLWTVLTLAGAVVCLAGVGAVAAARTVRAARAC